MLGDSGLPMPICIHVPHSHQRRFLCSGPLQISAAFFQARVVLSLVLGVCIHGSVCIAMHACMLVASQAGIAIVAGSLMEGIRLCLGALAMSKGASVLIWHGASKRFVAGRPLEVPVGGVRRPWRRPARG